jgi:spore coat protein A
VVKLGALGGAGLLIPAGGARGAGATVRRGAVPPPFSVPLAVPPVLRPVRRTETADHYRITMREADAAILTGARTRILGYEGLFPGPTIRARAGRRVIVEQVNGLRRDTVVHLHGGHTPSADDGLPMDVVEPGAARRYTYPNRQAAATLWYHDHAHMQEAEAVFRGLAGAYLLGDESEDRLRLPCGEHDVVLMLRDARFDDGNQFVFSMLDDSKARDVLLVNGRPQPYMKVAGRRYRLRFVNASNARHFALRLGDGAPMTQGERVEVVVDFSRYPAGTRLVLRNTDIEADGRTRDVMRFDVGPAEADPSRVPRRLRPMPPPGTAAATRDIVLAFNAVTGEPTINGRVYDADRVDERVAFGAEEIWRVINTDVTFRHNFHMHGLQFRVLDRGGKPVSGHEAGWKDTVAVPGGGGVVRLQVRFDRYRGRYVHHCHMLEHSSMGMMAQYEVV